MEIEQKVKELRDLFLEKQEIVGGVGSTFGNYDNKGNLIEGGIPTITTKFCEIGIYNEIVYFTFVIYSSSYNKNLFDNLKNSSDFQIYGFQDFSKNLYPKKDFNLNEFEKEIKKEKYFQINFDHSLNNDVEYLYKQYLTVKKLILDSGVKVVNQLEVDLITE